MKPAPTSTGSIQTEDFYVWLSNESNVPNSFVDAMARYNELESINALRNAYSGKDVTMFKYVFNGFISDNK